MRLSPQKPFTWASGWKSPIYCDNRKSLSHPVMRTYIRQQFNVTPDDSLRMSEVWKIVGAKSVRTVPLAVAKLVTWVRWRFFGYRLHPCWVEEMLVDFTGSNAKLRAAGSGGGDPAGAVLGGAAPATPGAPRDARSR